MRGIVSELAASVISENYRLIRAEEETSERRSLQMRQLQPYWLQV